MKSDCKILKQLEGESSLENDYTQGRISEQAKDILREDIAIYKELNKHGFVNEFDLVEIQELDKILDEFYGL